MSEEQLKSFLEKVKTDTSLQEKLKAATEFDAALAIAKEAGFAVTADDIQSIQSATDLSDDELEDVAGGICDPASRKSAAITADAISNLLGCKWI